MPRKRTHTKIIHLSSSSNSSSASPAFCFETPNFFESAPNSQSDVSPQITDSMEHNLWIEAQLNALHTSGTLRDARTENSRSIGKQSRILEGVKAYVDVKFKKASTLRQLLRGLGAIVYLRFSNNITHLIFWNGRQETLDRVHHLRNKISIISPHWVFKCFLDQARADEAPYLLYGVIGLAVPLRLMAMGRIGTVNKNIQERASKQSDSSLSQSEIVYAIETLSDQLASKLTSPENNENVDVVEIISPIVDRVRKRLDELSIAKDNLPMKRAPSGCGAPKVVDIRGGARLELSDDNRSVRTKARHTILRISGSLSEPSAQQFATPTADGSNSAGTVNLVEVTQSEPIKRRGRPPIKSDRLAEYTPIRFHRYLLRRCRSIKAKRALQLNTEKMVHLYRKMMDKDFDETPSGRQRSSRSGKVLKARPVAVRTRSSVLNDLQNAPSSNEFIKKAKIMKKRSKVGNIVLSGISKIERETVFAIARKLGVLKIANAVDEDTRYVVSDDEGVRTLNVMRAMVKGIPIVTLEWAYRSLEVGGWLTGNDYLVPRWKVAHTAWAKGQLARLFSSVGTFYVSPKCNPEARHLLHLIRCCHGKVTDSLNRAVVFVAPASEWKTLMLRRKNADTRVTYITEQSLLGTTNGSETN